jgi:hypothetical protein
MCSSAWRGYHQRNREIHLTSALAKAARSGRRRRPRSRSRWWRDAHPGFGIGCVFLQSVMMSCEATGAGGFQGADKAGGRAARRPVISYRQSAPQISIKDRSVKIVSPETTSEMAAKTMLGWPLLVAATSINCIKRRDVISAKRRSWRRVPKGAAPPPADEGRK